ncbi:MAG TPA: hypothetical protein PKJ69_02455 [Spirochaetota bacterium]|nr:hypothetical protein [Spirochaetota bacterium]
MSPGRICFCIFYSRKILNQRSGWLPMVQNDGNDPFLTLIERLHPAISNSFMILFL